jgi:hypothetical protein
MTNNTNPAGNPIVTVVRETSADNDESGPKLAQVPKPEVDAQREATSSR